MKVLKKIEFGKKYRCFNKGDTFHFRPGLNFLVGDQGCGKSTLLHCITSSPKMWKQNEISVEFDKGISYKYFDFEKDNPRKKGYIDKNAMTQVAAMWSSHGEVNLALLNAIDKFKETDLVLIDEPDQALSIKSIEKLGNILVNAASNGFQVLVSAHNPFLILSTDLVLSVQYKLWMPPAEFVKLQISDDTLKSIKVLLN